MTADVYATVAEAIWRYEANEFVTEKHNDKWAQGMARAAVDALAGMGDVTDEELVAVADEYDNCFDLSMVRLFLARARATDQARIAELELSNKTMTEAYQAASASLGRATAENLKIAPLANAAIEAGFKEQLAITRAEAAKARAAEADEELNRCYDRIEALKNERDELDGENRGLREHIDTYMAANADAIRAEATALRATVERVRALLARAEPDRDAFYLVTRADLRAALADPKGGGVTPGGNPTCPACGRWYVIHSRHECPKGDA